MRRKLQATWWARMRWVGVEPLERRVMLSVVYVDDTTAGPAHDGASWSTAYIDLQSALDAAATNSGADEIRVAAGIYRPTGRTSAADPRSATFKLSSGVRILGGFPDGGGSTAQRDPASHVTTLSGDIGARGSSGDNSYHVVYAVGVDNTAAVDGLTIRGGNDDRPNGAPDSSRGGGMFNVGASPVVNRCTFAHNSVSTYGAGMCNLDGGAPDVRSCAFIDNTAGTTGDGAGGYGAGIANMNASPRVTGCTFVGNSSYLGGAMYDNASSPTVTDCTFTGNSASAGGGAVSEVIGSSATYTACAFNGNSTAEVGGGLWVDDRSVPTLIDCTFMGNSAEAYGGAVSTINGSPRLTGCTFSGNSAVWYGGGIYSVGTAAPTLTACAFLGNWASLGGAMYNRLGAAPRLVNCVLTGNSVQSSGGAIYDDSASPTLTNCTLSGNAAGDWGGGMYNAGSFPSLFNCIVWGNTSIAGNSQIFDPPGGTPTTVHNSLVQGGWPGAGNLSADPLFVRTPSPGVDGRWGTNDRPSPDDDLGDLRLRPGSPAVDAGDASAVPAGVITDIAGMPRVVNGAVDLGAYEQPGGAAQTFEAERALITGAVVSASHAGFKGSGFVDYVHASGDAVEFAVNAPSAGWFELSFRYANGSSSQRAMALRVNGAAVAGGITFARTGSWTTWRNATVTVRLPAGVSRVGLAASGQSGPNLDSLSLRPSEPPGVRTYQAESAVLMGATVASDQAGFTGSGFADYRHGSGDFVEFTIDAPADGDYALEFRYANGSTSDRPLELRADGQVIQARLSFAPTGSWRAWQVVTRSVFLAAGRHTLRLTAVGSSGANLDALTIHPMGPA